MPPPDLTVAAGPLGRLFGLPRGRGVFARETIAGLTTFFAMSYVIFVNPAILGLQGSPDAARGLPTAAAVTSTCLLAGVMTMVMALVSRRAYAIAPGMGVNAVVAYQLVAGAGLTMPEAMGLVFIEGLCIVVLVVTGIRKRVFEAVPRELKAAVVVGIGFFVLFLGLVNGGIVQKGSGTPLRLGDLSSAGALLTVAGILVMGMLMSRGFRWAVPAGIVLITAAAVVLNWATGWTEFADGTADLPSALVAAPDFSLIGAFDFGSFARIGVAASILWIFTMMLSDFFDSFGTLLGVGKQAGYLDANDDLPGLNRLLLVDGAAAAVGGAFSSSSGTAYVESGAGVAAGGRSGWVGVIVSLCFLAAILFSPLVAIVPACATAPALVIVGYLMMRTVSEPGVDGRLPIDFRDITFGLPAVLTITMMPLTYSIADGVGAGFMCYVALRVAKGEARRVHPLLYVFTGVFAFFFFVPLIQRLLAS
jgi:AGZA family xanthine/uracil permease-like MFS transporter